MRLAVSPPPAYDRAPPQLFVVAPPPPCSSAAQDKIYPLRCPAGLSKDGAGLPATQDRTAPLSCPAGSAEGGRCGPQAHVSTTLSAQGKVALLQRQPGFVEGGIRTRPAHDNKPAAQVQGRSSGMLEDCVFREPPAHGCELSAQERLGAVSCFIGCPPEGGPSHVSRPAAVRDPGEDKKREIGQSGSEEPSSESSSIGSPEDSDDAVLSAGDDDNDVEEVQSQLGGGLGSLGSLEESLPIKRGLSNHFAGKSKSFGNLAEVSSVHELVKPENPFNKRRRTLIACKWFTRPSSSSSSFYCTPNPISMPVLLGALNEDDDDDQEDADADTAFQDHQDRLRESNRKIVKAFRSSSCFSLSDLQQLA